MLVVSYVYFLGFLRNEAYDGISGRGKKDQDVFKKALDLLKKRPVTNDRKNIKTGCTNHLIQPVFIFIGLYTTD